MEANPGSEPPKSRTNAEIRGVQPGGPDRGWDRPIELTPRGLEISPLPPRLFGVEVLGVEALLAA